MPGGVEHILSKLDTMNKPIEEVFMNYIEDINTISLTELNDRLEPFYRPPDLGADLWEERDWVPLDLVELDCPVITLRPAAPADIVAIDASVLRVAESRQGPVIGLRAAIVYRSPEGVSVKVIGPVLRLVKPASPLSVGYEVGEELRYFERLLQLWAVTNIRASIYLFDGTLVAGYDRSSHLLEAALEAAGYTGCTILAFSKESLLARTGSEKRLEDGNASPPYLRDLTSPVKSIWSGIRPLGSVFLARLAPSLYPFRVDAYPGERGVDALSSLLSSDALIHGYPETLVLAHTHATFSWMDVVAMRSTLLGQASTATSVIFNQRLTVLTPFETRGQ
ncbi:MAG: hypothetical protein QW815_06360 [Nitrososphaerota archaeon]